MKKCELAVTAILFIVLFFTNTNISFATPSEHQVNGINSGWCYPLDDNHHGKPIENISFGFMSYKNTSYPYHYAQDFTIGYNEGDSVYAMADGKIVRIRKTGGYGGGNTCTNSKGEPYCCSTPYNTLVVEHNYFKKDGTIGKVYIFYGHVKNILGVPENATDQELKVAVKVKRGDKIAELNNPSCAGWPVHLHLTVMPDADVNTIPGGYFDGYNDTQNKNGRARPFDCSNNIDGTWSKDWVDKYGIQKIPADDEVFFDTYNPSSTTTRFMDFEDGTDGNVIRSKIAGLFFTTTQGYDWIYGDWRAGYNGPYPNGSYYSNGNFFAWLGPNQGTGRIDFIGSTARSLSVWTSTYSGLIMDAYDSNNKLIATSGWATYNLDTGKMTNLTVSASNMSYVLIHDSGNYWLIDDLEVSDLLSDTKAYLPDNFLPQYENLNTTNQNDSKWQKFINKIRQNMKIILGWGGSELLIRAYAPDGSLYDELQSNTSPIIMDIPDAEPGEWQFEVVAINVPHDNYPFALVIGLPDSDGDGVTDQDDNCPNIANSDQADNNNNGIGDVCEAIPGDFDGDGDVDKNDINILLTYRNKPASAYPAADLDGDGMITVLDARKLVLLCTKPSCACE